jgi:DnaD/phage-associated family protein
MDGWFKLHRKITESAIFSDPDLLRLWIYCLSKAAYKPTTVLVEKQEISLESGQFLTGRFSLHQEYNAGVAPRKKIKETTLWSWLKRLESYGNLDIKSYNKFSVVTVVKWNEYQETLTTEPQQSDNRLTTERQQTDTNKKLKNLEKDKKLNNISSSTGESEYSVMAAYTKSFGQLVMPETIRDYLRKIREQGQKDEMIIELLLEAGESSTKPNLRFLEAIGQRWIENGITSREQSKAHKDKQREQKTVPLNKYRKPDKPAIPIVTSETTNSPSDEEFEEMMRFAAEMQQEKRSVNQ